LHAGTTVGSADAKGICNLQNPATGAYVDFSLGRNGFQRDRAYQHTLIHHSSEYRNVLVQANILEAITNVDYFTSIIERYARPDEKLIVYMDVNGTILWDDTMMGQGPTQVLLSTMFGLLQMRPWAPCEFEWDGRRKVRLEQPQVLKQLVQDIAGGDGGVYHEFWKAANCERFLRELCELADVSWTLTKEVLTPQGVMDEYERYRDELQRHSQDQPLVASWFRCMQSMRQAGHSLIIQSFGMDTRRVVLMSVGDERKVPHIAINFELWSEKDSSRFVEQFRHAEPPPSPCSRATRTWHRWLGDICGVLGRGSCCERDPALK